jgi:hypothetical protein
MKTERISMSSNSKKLVLAAFIITFTAVNCAFAGFWDALNPYRSPKNRIVTLVITGNYKHPLLIAQLIQQETKQPYLLLPAASGKGIFFNPPRKRSEAALEIREENLTRFIRFLSPKQIVILGDDRYVPEKYRKLIDKNIPVITVTGKNWQRIADCLTILLAANNVGDDYKELGQQLDSGLYKPTKSNKPLDAPVPAKPLEVKEVDASAKDTAAPAAPAPALTPKAEASPKTVKEPEPLLPKNTPKMIETK